MIKISEKMTMVKPAEKTPRRTVSLSIVDRLNHFPQYNSVVHVYKPTGDGGSGAGGRLLDAGVLKGSLSKVLVEFYPLAGRYRLDGGGDLEIDCNDEGALFVEVESDSTVDDLGDFAPTPEFRKLVPGYTISDDVSSYVLMVAQVTYFKCGGVTLGISTEHHTTDGTSAAHVTRSWSEIARGLDISLRPVMDRSILRPLDPPRPKFNHPEYDLYGSSGDHESAGKTSDDIKVSVFKMTKDQLAALKAEAKRDDQTAGLTTFEALAGHVWRCVCRARRLAGYERETRLTMCVSGRSRLDRPKIPPGYFGNVYFKIVASAAAGEIQTEPVNYAAERVHEALARTDDGYLRSAIDHVSVLPDLSVAKLGPHCFESPHFQVTSWVRIGINDGDFGWGPPVYSGPGGLLFEKAYIFSADEKGDLTVAISLKADHMEDFGKFFYEFV